MRRAVEQVRSAENPGWFVEHVCLTKAAQHGVVDGEPVLFLERERFRRFKRVFQEDRAGGPLKQVRSDLWDARRSINVERGSRCIKH